MSEDAFHRNDPTGVLLPRAINHSHTTGPVFDRVSHFIAQEPPITLAQIVQLFFYDRLRNAQSDGEVRIRDIGVLGREIIAQSLKKPKTSFTFTFFTQTPERLVHNRRRP